MVSALQALQSYGLTLRDAGVAFRDEDLLRAVDDDPKAWAQRFKLLYHPAHVSEALHLMGSMAPAFAVDCLRELDALHRPEARFGGSLPTRISFGVNPVTGDMTPIPAGPTPARVAMLERQKKAQRDLASRQLRGLLRFVQRQFVNPGQAIELIHAIQVIDDEAGRSIGAALSADGNWGKRVRALLDTDAPGQLGNLLRMMAEANLDLPDEVLDRLFRAWRPQAYQFRSPIIAQSITCGFAASGPRGVQMAREWVESLNIERIARRLDRGLPSDVEMAPKLIRALDVWGPPGSAEEIVHALPVDAVSLVDVGAAAEVLRTLEGRFPDNVHVHAESAADAITAQAQIRYVRDPEQHWRDLGWLIRTTRALIGEAAVDPKAVLADLERGCRRPEVVSWVTGCLGRAPDDESWFLLDASAPA